MNEINNELFPVKIKEYANRIINLEEDRKEIAGQVSTVYQEAESKGFNKKALKQALKLLNLQKEDRDRQLSLTEQYLDQIGG